MNAPAQHEDSQTRGQLRSILVRLVKLAAYVLVAILVLIVFVIWLGGDTSTLPFDYDGFD